jgi:lysozyme family protein
MNFDAAFPRIINVEQGLQKDPRDRGNWTGGAVGKGELRGTKYGVSAAAYPNLDIENLTLDQAKAIYEPDYWIRAGCDALPDVLRFDVFDTAVNSGVGLAGMLLQKALGDSYKGKIDGDVGPKTRAAIAAWPDSPYRLLVRFDGHRLDFLNDNPGLWADYGRGWAQRMADNMKAA